MSVGRICVREVDTADPEESVAVAAERMHQRAVGTLIVVNDANQVIGILTDRDLVARVLAKGMSATETTVKEAMTVGPKTVSEETPIEAALLIMRTGRFRRLPVVDRQHRLLGLVSLDDILMLLSEEFSQIGRLLRRETPRGVIEDYDSTGVARLPSDSRLVVGD